jgi:WD40 repeat protein
LLSVVSSLEGTSIVDVLTRRRIARVPMTGIHAQAPGCLVYASPGDPEGASLHVWDTRTRTESRVVPSAIGELTELTWIDPGKLLVASGLRGDDVAHELFDLATGKCLLAYQGWPDTGGPAASPDGKWLAYGVVKLQGSDFRGKTTLVERSSGRAVATSSACRYPTSVAFSSTSRRLAVGDLRRACVLDVPSLRLVARTGQARGNAGAEDDLQATTVGFAARDSMITVRTADGSLGLYRSNGRTIWAGRGEAHAGSSDTLHVVDEDRSRLWSISPQFTVTERALSEAERAGSVPVTEIGQTPWSDGGAALAALVRSQVCHVGPWLVPRAACER